MKRLATALAALFLGGCSGDDGSLIVDVRTDYVAGVEYTAIEVELEDGRLETVAVRRDEDLVSTPRRAATFEGLPPGPVRLVVRLVDPDGEVTTRDVVADVTETLGVTVVISRTCASISCPGSGDAEATECLAGRCVVPECTDGTQPSCEPTGAGGECVSAAECTEASACGQPACLDGVCLYSGGATECAPPEYCDPTAGCREPGAPVYEVVEALPITVFGEQIVSTTVLDASTTYRLRASGTWDLGGGAIGDADWYLFSMPRDIGDASIDIGLGVDDDVVDGDTRPDWGPYRDDHVYEIDYPGTGATITAQIHDCCYGNNAGELLLEILAPR